MGLIKKLRDRFRKKEWEEEYDDTWSDAEDISEVNYDDKTQRTDYVKDCLERMADATKELENLSYEYDMVTSYLKDMAEI